MPALLDVLRHEIGLELAIVDGRVRARPTPASRVRTAEDRALVREYLTAFEAEVLLELLAEEVGL